MSGSIMAHAMNAAGIDLQAYCHLRNPSCFENLFANKIFDAF
jgi:hypothetical protein